MKVFLLFLVLLLFSSVDLFAADRGMLMWSKNVGADKWPLSTEFAIVSCDNRRGEHAVYLTTCPDGKNCYGYAVNGAARGAMKRLGLDDALEIMKEGFPPYKLGVFIETGMKVCEN